MLANIINFICIPDFRHEVNVVFKDFFLVRLVYKFLFWLNKNKGLKLEIVLILYFFKFIPNLYLFEILLFNLFF